MKKFSSCILVLFLGISSFAQKPGPALLHPTNHTLVLIDMQGQMAFATKNIDVIELRNNTAIVAGASKIFKVPTIVTTIAEKSFSGPVFPELSEFYPSSASPYIERTTMNAWEDNRAHKTIVAKGNKKIVFAGLWTSVCIGTAALSAIHEGYEVYFITDACGDVSKEAHDRSIQRMIAAGATPVTSIQYLLELQRDWARSDTYKPVTDLIKKYGGAYGIGTQYAHDMLPKH
jgi:nicotinamidase-related amidase